MLTQVAMKYNVFYRALCLVSACVVGAFSQPSLEAETTLPATTVAAGDGNQTSAVLWAHSFSLGTVVFDLSKDPTFLTGVVSASVAATDALLPCKASFT